MLSNEIEAGDACHCGKSTGYNQKVCPPHFLTQVKYLMGDGSSSVGQLVCLLVDECGKLSPAHAKMANNVRSFLTVLDLIK